MENKWKDHTNMVSKIGNAIFEYHSFCKKNFSWTTSEEITKEIEEITKSYLEYIKTMENVAKL